MSIYCRRDMGLYIVLNVGCHFIVEWNQFCKKADQF